MSQKRYRPSKRIPLTDLCSQPGQDDGVDPRRVSPGGGDRRPQFDRKILQLCGQVAHVVAAVLSGEVHDDDLAGLEVARVVPAAQRGRLLVIVVDGPVPPIASAETILAKLEAQSRRIRAEVGAAITRRKTPELTFAYLPKSQLAESESLGGAEDRHA